MPRTARADRWAPRLPWIDGLAAATVGVLMLVLRGPASAFYGMRGELFTTIALANVLYSTLGLTLGALRERPAWLLSALVTANLSWAVVCVALVALAPPGVTVWGYAHIVGEGVIVVSLAVLERRHRRAILAPDAR